MEDNKKEAPRWVGGIEPAKELLTATGTQILEIECRQQPERLRQLLEAYAGDSAIQAELKKFRNLAAKRGRCCLSAWELLIVLPSAGRFCCSRTGARRSLSMPENGCIMRPRCGMMPRSLSCSLLPGRARNWSNSSSEAGDRALGLICNNPASTCWHLAENKLPILAGPEYGNATKTYTNATAAAIILASEIVGRPWKQEAEHAAEVFSAHLDPIFAMRGDLEMFCRGAANIEVIGRGAAYGGAFMSALCIREMSGHRAAAHTGAGFKHGPNLDVDATHVAIIFAFGRTAELGVKLAQECNRRGGKVVLVSSEEHTPPRNCFRSGSRRSRAMGGHHVPAGPQALTWHGRADRMPAPPRFQYGVMEQ